MKRDAQGTDAGVAAGKPAGEEARRGTNRIEAMRHPLRARILRLLIERGVMSPAELSRALLADVKHVSYHTHQLVKLGCAEPVEERSLRGGVEHLYRGIERPFVDTAEYEELDPIVADDIVSDSFQRIIDDFVASRKGGMFGIDGRLHLTRTPLIVDDEGLDEGLKCFERCRDEMSEIERKSSERLATSGDSGIVLSSDLLLFRVPSGSLRS